MSDTNYRFEHVPGFFHQDSLPVHISAEASLDKSFGLIEEGPERWANFIAKLDALNANATDGESYKLIYFGRHGQGFHNVAEVYYHNLGTWESKWGREYTDGNLTWGPDPYLTEKGEGQARTLNKAWVAEAPHGIPLPTKWFTSPLRRTIKTCLLSWQGTWGEDKPDGKGVGVVGIENLREVCGMNTCDKRRPISEAKAEFPHIQFDSDISEADEMWDADVHETDEHVQSRVHSVLSRVWEGDDLYVSLTAHCGTMQSAFRLLKHVDTKPVTAEMVPMVIRRVKN